MGIRHYNESAIFKKIRARFGIEKPLALPWGEWDVWQKQTRAEHPIGYWLTEDLPRMLEWFPRTFLDPLYSMRAYYRNRWVDKYHVLPTGLEPGKYHDLRERLLHGCMESLVDFIEIEKAWINHIWGDAELPQARYPKAGLDHLSWEMGLDDRRLPDTERSPSQAEAAREQYRIYVWWKSRPGRLDPLEVSGWREYCNYQDRMGRKPFGDDRRTPEEEKWSDEAHKSLRDIEEEYDQQDEEYLIRLMKIRNSLWT